MNVLRFGLEIYIGALRPLEEKEGGRVGFWGVCLMWETWFSRAEVFVVGVRGWGALLGIDVSMN